MKLRLNASSVVVGLTIGALAAGGITYAAGNAGGTTINACQSKSTGALRVLTTGTCKSTEAGVSWNSQGPQGDQGVPGVEGPRGERGPATYADSLDAVQAAIDVPGAWATYPAATGKSAYVYPGNDIYRMYAAPANVRVVVHKVIAPNVQGYYGIQGYLVPGGCSEDAFRTASSSSTQWMDLPQGVQDLELGQSGVAGGCVLLVFRPISNGPQAVRLAWIASN